MTPRPSTNARSPRSATRLLPLLAASLFAAAIACGGAGAKAPPKVNVPEAGATRGATELTTSPPPSGLPAMAPVPPPGVAGSKKATRRGEGGLAACTVAARAPAKDPAELVKRLGEGCAAASKMKPLGPILRGNQSDKDGHQENKFRAEANHCYRIYFAGDEGIKDLVAVLRDSAGDIVAEAPSPAVPEGAVACFSSSDEVSILVGVGNGKGAWAAQVWSD